MDRDDDSADNILMRFLAWPGPHTGVPVRCTGVFTVIYNVEGATQDFALPVTVGALRQECCKGKTTRARGKTVQRRRTNEGRIQMSHGGEDPVGESPENLPCAYLNCLAAGVRRPFPAPRFVDDSGK